MKGHIKSVSVFNVQSHEDTVMNFSPGVNAIVGVSDSGKSAFYRAISWLITNKNGKGLRSRWGGETAVEMTFDDDVSVCRSVDKGNVYELSTMKQPFTAFKTDIPMKVAEAINMDEINLQTQLDSPFLLSPETSPGDVAKILNKIANLTAIDTSVSNIAKKSREIKANMSNTLEQIEELEKQEKSFTYLAQMEKDVKEWQSLCKKQAKVNTDIKQLESLIADIERDQEDIEEIGHLLSIEKKVNEAVSLAEKQKELRKEIWTLLEFIRKIEAQTVEINSFIDLFEIEESVDKALSLLDEQKEVRGAIQNLSRLITNISAQQIRLASDDVVIKQLENEFKRSFPKVCPLCEK